MTARAHSMPEAWPATSRSVHIVQVEVSLPHPRLLVKQALPWEAITEAMTRHWHHPGKNVDGGPGLPWDVALDVPLVVLILITTCDARQREAYVAENVVARVCIGRHGEAQAQMREHSHLARADAAVGKAGIDARNHLVLKEAQRCGCVDARGRSADPTAQALPMGSPNAPGSLRGLAQRCGRALPQMHQRGRQGLASVLHQVQTIVRSVHEHHLVTAGKAAQREVLTRILTEVGAWIVHPRPLVKRREPRAARVLQSARARRMAMHEVLKPLMGQIVPGISTGQVAANTIVHVGLPQARAMVCTKVDKQPEVGWASLRSRLGGGYRCGTLIAAKADERPRPRKALSGYRALCGQEATPELVVSDRGGDATATCNRLTSEKVTSVGMQPKGQRPWAVAEAVRDQMRSARGRTAGSLGTLKSHRYQCNKPTERLWHTLEMAGPRSIFSFNLHKFMRDCVELTR